MNSSSISQVWVHTLHKDLICIHSPLWSDAAIFPILSPHSFFMYLLCSNHTTGTRFQILTECTMLDHGFYGFLCPEFSLCLSQSVSSPRFKVLPTLSERINSATIMDSLGTFHLSSATQKLSVIGKKTIDSILDLLIFLCLVILALCLKECYYSLKYTGQPILKALAFRSPFIYILKGYRIEINICLGGGSPWHRFTGTSWPGQHGQLQTQRLPTPRSFP